MNLKVNKKKLFRLDFSNTINSMKIKSSFIVCFLIFGFFGFSQKVQLKKAASSYDQFHYVDAIKTYEKVANKGYKSVELFSKLGDSYYFQSNLNEANKWYEQLFALNQKVDSEYYFRYAQTLKSIGDYKKADEMMTAFHKFNSADLRAILAKNQINYLEEIQVDIEFKMQVSIQNILIMVLHFIKIHSFLLQQEIPEAFLLKNIIGQTNHIQIFMVL